MDALELEGNARRTVKMEVISGSSGACPSCPGDIGLERASSIPLSRLSSGIGSVLDSAPVRRLFSTFAHGAPGAGLLLMRVAVGGALIVRAVAVLASGPGPGVAAFQVLAVGVGVLLLAGLWTPVVSGLAVLAAALGAFSNPGDLGFYALLGTLGAALALLGPGAWSVDARLFGWKRVEIRNGKRQDAPPY